MKAVILNLHFIKTRLNTCSVTRFGEISPLRLIFTVFWAKCKIFISHLSKKLSCFGQIFALVQFSFVVNDQILNIKIDYLVTLVMSDNYPYKKFHIFCCKLITGAAESLCLIVDKFSLFLKIQSLQNWLHTKEVWKGSVNPEIHFVANLIDLLSL